MLPRTCVPVCKLLLCVWVHIGVSHRFILLHEKLCTNATGRGWITVVCPFVGSLYDIQAKIVFRNCCVVSVRVSENPLYVSMSISKFHLEERLLDQAQARASCTLFFWGSFA